METPPTQPAPPESAPPSAPAMSRRQFLTRNLALVGAISLGDGLGEPNDVEVTRHRVALRGLNKPVRIAQLTDLHRSWCVSEGYIARVVAQTNAEKPDLVALTGDFVTRSSFYAPSCTEQLAQLNAPLGRYAVLGNHDYWCDHYQGVYKVANALTQANIEVLTNYNTKFDCGLRLVGLDDCWAGKPDPWAAFRGIHSGDPVVAMTHNPNYFIRMREYDCVTLAGHTHGGQINIPVVTRRMIQSWAPYMRGWYHKDKYPGRMYVSRGLGVVSIPMRFRSRPEIAIFDLIPA